VRTLTSLLGNGQRLDGGAMFGNAPKALWSRWVAPDDANRIPLACRALLVRDAGQTLLFDPGVGAFFPPDLRARYGVEEPQHVLLDSLAAAGVAPEDVDRVVLSHLHFDHAGGVLARWREGAEPTLAFPRARFLAGREAWERARAPHPRDRASFAAEICAALEASGRLDLVAGDDASLLGEGYRFHRSHGHTPGLLVSEITMPEGPVVFASDLVPGRAWVHLPITMGYDRSPELLVDEKRALLEGLEARGGRLFYFHDAEVALSRVARDERGRFRAVEEAATLSSLAA